MNYIDGITNFNLVVEKLGEWFDFHDAEILSIHFERDWDCKETSILMKIYTF